jgi:hypothetical protein
MDFRQRRAFGHRTEMVKDQRGRHHVEAVAFAWKALSVSLNEGHIGPAGGQFLLGAVQDPRVGINPR